MSFLFAGLPYPSGGLMFPRQLPATDGCADAR
jgi:hypothetical protein